MIKNSRGCMVFVFLALFFLCVPQKANALGETAEVHALLMEIQALRSDLRNYYILGIGAQQHLIALGKLEVQLEETEKQILSHEVDLKTNLKEKEDLDKDIPDYENRVRDYDLYSYKTKITIDSLVEKGFDIKNKISEHKDEMTKLLEKYK